MASFPLSDSDHQHTHGKKSVGASFVFLECVINKIFLENIFQRDSLCVLVGRNAASCCPTSVGLGSSQEPVRPLGSLLLRLLPVFPCRGPPAGSVMFLSGLDLFGPPLT